MAASAADGPMPCALERLSSHLEPLPLAGKLLCPFIKLDKRALIVSSRQMIIKVRIPGQQTLSIVNTVEKQAYYYSSPC